MSDSHSTSPRDGGAASPIHSFLHRLRAGLQKFRRKKPAEDSIREAIAELIEDDTAETAAIDTDERLLLHNILRLRDVTAYDVMVPRADIVAVEISTPLSELIQRITREAHSRMPVYRETLDDVLGIVHIKDVIGLAANAAPLDLTKMANAAALDLTKTANAAPFDLAKIVRRALFVSPSMRVLDLLLEMRLARLHMAMVVDEYGGVDGLVTIEDIIEAIVGDIEDEHDVDSPPGMIDRPDGAVLADARTDVARFEAKYGAVLSEEERAQDIDTLGGLVVYLAGRVPPRGAVIAHPSGLEFEVVDRDQRRVRRLLIRNLPRAAETPETSVQQVG